MMMTPLVKPALLADLRIPSRCKVLPPGPARQTGRIFSGSIATSRSSSRRPSTRPVALRMKHPAGTGFVALSSSVPVGRPFF